MNGGDRIAVLGGGLIGAGWAAAFAGAGHEVVVLDPDPAAPVRLADQWQQARPVLARMGQLSPDAHPPRMGGPDDATNAVFLQESLPEDIALKRQALRDLGPHLDRARAIASSSSSLPPDLIAEGTGLADRLLIGHPCNPPWLMPVVEISAATACTPDAAAAARALYEGIGKTVLTLRKPLPGHLVNRLQAALWREAVHLVASGAASLEDTERAVSLGLAPRWCDVGPHGVFSLAGGARGMEGFLDALGPAFQALFDDLGAPRLDGETRALLIRAARTDLPPPDELRRRRDTRLPDRLTRHTLTEE